MRWSRKLPKSGDKRLIARFAWLPTGVNKEWIWLEPYWVLESYWSGYDWDGWSIEAAFADREIAREALGGEGAKSAGGCPDCGGHVSPEGVRYHTMTCPQMAPTERA